MNQSYDGWKAGLAERWQDQGPDWNTVYETARRRLYENNRKRFRRRGINAILAEVMIDNIARRIANRF